MEHFVQEQPGILEKEPDNKQNNRLIAMTPACARAGTPWPGVACHLHQTGCFVVCQSILQRFYDPAEQCGHLVGCRIGCNNDISAIINEIVSVIIMSLISDH